MSKEDISPQCNLCQDTAAKQVYGTSRLCKVPEALDTFFYAYPQEHIKQNHKLQIQHELAKSVLLHLVKGA